MYIVNQKKQSSTVVNSAQRETEGSSLEPPVITILPCRTRNENSVQESKTTNNAINSSAANLGKVSDSLSKGRRIITRTCKRKSEKAKSILLDKN